VELSVLDKGPGIREEDLPHIFSPFYRSTDALRRGVEGTGLGLSIAQRLAHACGGVLSATSQVRQGSCFTLRLPAVEAPIECGAQNSKQKGS
jgi:signal transduction histidine kinase